MKFGVQLRTSLIKDYYFHYISYDDLKELLRKSAKSTSEVTAETWTDIDEKNFVKRLEDELDKVYNFQQFKASEILRRIKSNETAVYSVVARLEQQPENEPLRETRANGSNGTNDTGPPTEQDFTELEEEISDVIADVHDLAKFTQLNYTGFKKILKKHDKVTSRKLKADFTSHRLSEKPFYADNYDGFIVKLSKLYDIVRTRGNPSRGDSAAGGSQQNFVRQTTKYWVHPDNITELKLIILKHLPVLVFNPNKEFEAKDSAISSIYYDNPQTWELYEGRLKKTEGAEAVRLRWYGDVDVQSIFIERKTHREDWTGEKSVKARFTTKEKNVNAFLAGYLSVDQVFEKMEREGKKSKKEIADLKALAREVQYSVNTRGLVPVVRSFYNRTAFQLPGDARVRISLDTELTMVREDNIGRERSGKNWRRRDVGIDYPFPDVSPEDIERFPYAVLEVKLQTQVGQEPPQWIRDLIGSHLVEAVPKFSKFIHGTATLFPDRIDLLPFWLPQMGVDIRKPITHQFGIERPGQSTLYSTSDDISDSDEEEEQQALANINVRGDMENEDMRRLRMARESMVQYEEDRARDFISTGNLLDIEERPSNEDINVEQPLYDSDSEEEEATNKLRWRNPSKTIRRGVDSLTTNVVTGVHSVVSPLSKVLPASNYGSTRQDQMKPALLEAKKFKAPKGKRIHVPVRVEPKVYFAAERTFLAWLEFCIILGAIAASLLNFGDDISLATAWGFTFLVALTLLYSLFMYVWRVYMIRRRRAVQYHDIYGPLLLCLGMLGAVLVNFGFTVREKGWFKV